ncbi:hypothetical protein B484DRAFT_394345 [Ochromonadaceae sp. CCMP2298]|nr:hypothetical protein B484DRAFT_394345 [Ochromonadaceae sp. CCMP2298]
MSVASTVGFVKGDSVADDRIAKYFEDSVALPSGGVSSIAAVATANEVGRQNLQTLKRPFGKDEAWRHTNLRKLFAFSYEQPQQDYAQQLQLASLEPLIDAQCLEACLVFIDGKFAPHLSRTAAIPQDIIAGPLSSLSADSTDLPAMQLLLNAPLPESGEFARNSFASDVLGALNQAHVQDAACVVVPAGIHVEAPLQVLFCSTASAVSASATPAVSAPGSYPRLLVSLGEGAALQLKQSFFTLLVGEDGTPRATDDGAIALVSQPAMVNSYSRLEVARGAKLVHTYTQELSLDTRHIEVLSASVGTGGAYDVTVLQSGAAIGRVNAHIALAETQSNCSLHCITLAGERQSLDLHSNILHGAPDCVSRQQQRNVIADKGEAIFKGRIQVPKVAQLTNSDQLCRSVMLGQRARVVAMPTLEIQADNVECSHGASVQDLDENSMFYLAARGVDRAEARKLLLRGFVFDLLAENVMDERGTRRIVRKLEAMYPKEVRGELPTSGQKFMSI